MSQHLKDQTIFLTVAGSHLYGTASAESDLDVAGVFRASPQDYIGLQAPPEQYNDKALIGRTFQGEMAHLPMRGDAAEGVDGTIFEVRKFASLASNSNPNILDILFAPPHFVLVENDVWRKEVMPVRDRFLSKQVYWTFRGYARGQLDRMERHRKWLLNAPEAPPRRSDFGLPEGGRSIPANQLEAVNSRVRDVLDRWDLKLDDSLPRADVLNIQEMMRTILDEIVGAEPGALSDRAVDSLGLEANFVELVKKEHAYDRAVAGWNSYQKWKEGRNPKRAALEARCGYDAKHAMHSLRLLLQTAYILREGTYRPHNPAIVEELKVVRRGDVPYERIVARVKEAEALAAEAFDGTPLPKRADLDTVNQMVFNIITLTR